MNKIRLSIGWVFLFIFFLWLFLGMIIPAPSYKTFTVVLMSTLLVVLLFRKKIEKKNRHNENKFLKFMRTDVADRILLIMAGLAFFLIFMASFLFDKETQKIYLGTLLFISAFSVVYHLSRNISEKNERMSKRFSIIGAVINAIIVASFFVIKEKFNLPIKGFVVEVSLFTAELYLYWTFMFVLARYVFLKGEKKENKWNFEIYAYSLISLFLIAVVYTISFIKPGKYDFIIKMLVEINWFISVLLIGLNKVKKKNDKFNVSRFFVEQFYFQIAVIFVVIRIGLYVKDLFHIA